MFRNTTDHHADALLTFVMREYAEPKVKAAMDRAARQRRLMRRAWWIAKEAACVFGGKPSQYVKGAMLQAWAERRGEINAFNADATLMRIEARNKKRRGQMLGQRVNGQHGRNWYASAVGW